MTTVDVDEHTERLIHDEMTVTEYAPDVFAFLRQLDGYDAENDNKQLKESFDLKANLKSIKKARESAGKSGAFFFFSHDKKFLIKTGKLDKHGKPNPTTPATWIQYYKTDTDNNITGEAKTSTQVEGGQ